MTDAEHHAPVGFETETLEDCWGCRGKTFPGHECDGVIPTPDPTQPTWPTHHDV